MNDAELAGIRDAFNGELVERQSQFFLRRQPDEEELALDAEARAALGGDIIVRRPQVFLPRGPGVALRPHAAAELTRNHLLYLIRLAPLAEGLELTLTGNFFSTLPREDTDIATYRNRYTAKFGYTTRRCGVRLTEVLDEITSKGFPENNLHPYVALAIDGLPHDRQLLHQMEHGLRNLLDRDGLRLRQHAQGVLYPGNRTAMAETFEFVHADVNCNRLFQLFEQYARRLDAVRRWVRALVNVFDIRRNQDIQNDRDEILARYEDLRQEAVAGEALQGGERAVDGYVYDAVTEEELLEVEANHRRLDVRTLYFSALQYAAATFTVRM
ncbi:hypothetical protein V7S43_009404 [Phytophthora oleae]|uniref:Uncharacterized protein n=1 Tax=Phytophthora oleae TaxID=2107226 RepID=A0ABD3FII7_9STRA